MQASHVEFGGRVAPGFDAFGGTADDVNGHGTHCGKAPLQASHMV
jgi:hypothetical protein